MMKVERKATVCPQGQRRWRFYIRLHSVHYEVYDYTQYSFEMTRKLKAKRVGPAVLRRSRKRCADNPPSSVLQIRKKYNGIAEHHWVKL